MSDDLLEVSESAKMSREAAAAKLRAIADQLSKHNQIEFVREGVKYSAKVPSTVEFSVEIELGEDNEIEIEISW